MNACGPNECERVVPPEAGAAVRSQPCVTAPSVALAGRGQGARRSRAHRRRSTAEGTSTLEAAPTASLAAHLLCHGPMRCGRGRQDGLLAKELAEVRLIRAPRG